MRVQCELGLKTTGLTIPVYELPVWISLTQSGFGFALATFAAFVCRFLPYPGTPKGYSGRSAETGLQVYLLLDTKEKYQVNILQIR